MLLVSVRARERQGVVRALEGLGGGVRAHAQGCGLGAERRAGRAERAAPARKSRSASACALRAARSGRRPGESGVCRVLKGKQLEITRSGQRRVWETRKAAGSVQSTAAFTCLGKGGGAAPRGGARPLRPWKYSSASAWTQVTSAIQELAGLGRTPNFCVPEVPHLQSGRGDHVSLGALGDRDNG